MKQIKKVSQHTESCNLDAKLPCFVPSTLFSYFESLDLDSQSFSFKRAFERELPYIGSDDLELKSFQLKATGSKSKKCPSTRKSVWIPGAEHNRLRAPRFCYTPFFKPGAPRFCCKFNKAPPTWPLPRKARQKNKKKEVISFLS